MQAPIWAPVRAVDPLDISPELLVCDAYRLLTELLTHPTMREAIYLVLLNTHMRLHEHMAQAKMPIFDC